MKTIAIESRERGLTPRCCARPCRVPRLHRRRSRCATSWPCWARHRRRDAALVHGHHRRAAALQFAAHPGLPADAEASAAAASGPAPRARCAGQARHAGDGAGRRRRHLRHRLPVPVLGGRAQREHPLLLPRQRGLHEYRGAEVLVDAAFRARTGSTPAGKTTRKKNLTEIMAAHGVPYVPPPASATSTTRAARSPRPRRCAGCA